MNGRRRTQKVTDSPPAPEDARGSLSRFLKTSKYLTGFKTTELLGTGMAEAYYEELQQAYGRELVARLILEMEEIAKRYPPEAEGSGKIRVDCGASSGGGVESESEFEQQVLKRIFSDDSDLCPVAKNLIQMWYLGTMIDYTDLTTPIIFKRTVVVSAEAYQQALVYRTIQSHPPAAKHPGYASWALGQRPARETRTAAEEQS